MASFDSPIIAGTLVRPDRSPPVDSVEGEPRPLPGFRGTAFLAATADEVALCEGGVNVFGLRRARNVLARAARAQLVSASIVHRKFVSDVELAFANGVVWKVAVERMQRRKAAGLVRALDAK